MDEVQAEFICKHVEGTKVVANTGVGSIGIHDDVGIVRSPNEELPEKPELPAVVGSCLIQACNLVFLVHSSHVAVTRGKVTWVQKIHAKLGEKSPKLTYLVKSTTRSSAVNCASLSPTCLHTVDALLRSWSLLLPSSL